MNSERNGETPDLATIVRTRILERVLGELPAEEDEGTALRKALLAFILLTQEDSPSYVLEYVEYLLRSFSPLTDSFEDASHAFLSDARVLARTADAGHAVLAFPDEFIHRLLAGGAGPAE